MVTNQYASAAAAFVAVLLTAAPTVAQDRLFHFGYELGAIGRFGERLGPARGLDRPLVGGGRFAVGDTDVIDLRTGARRPLPAGAVVTAFDPSRPRILLTLRGSGPIGTRDVGVFDVVTGMLQTIVTSACSSSFLAGVSAMVGYAYDTQTVVVQRCASDQVVQDLVAVDLAMPLRQPRLLPIVAPPASALEVSADGQRVFLMAVASLLTYTIDAYDSASGALVGSSGAVDFLRELHWDDALDALVVTSGGGFLPAGVRAFSRSLEPLGSAPFTSTICPPSVQISPHTGRIYVTTNGGNNTGAAPVVVEAFAGQPLQRVARGLPSSGLTPSCEGAELRTAPGAPRRLAASVTGDTVTLDWINVGGASAFVLDVGLAPGRTDLSLLLGPDSQASFSAVPAGTYYVRVRGGNEFGGGRPSQELRVVVP